jgi:acetylornithine/N-succinyldiaminopimelate aminotransferase
VHGEGAWLWDNAGNRYLDFATIGKMLGGGVPLAALVATEAVSCFAPGDQGGTFNGNPLMTAVGGAVLEAVLAPGFLETVQARGDYLAAQLASLSHRHRLGAMHGRGLLLAHDLRREIATQVVERARDLGLLLNAPRPHLLRFMSALNVSREEIDAMLGLLEQALTDRLI